MSDTFCVMPFLNIYLERNGDYVACGHSSTGNINNSNINTTPADIAFNDDYFKKLRLDLLNGVRNENCKVCWYKEDKGMTSARQQHNKFYEEYIPLCKTSDGTIDIQPIQVGIKSDNLCNLKCIMCNQYQSSQHEKEVKEMRERDIKIPIWLDKIEEHNKGNFYNTDYIIENIDGIISNKSKLEIQGGEPLISPITHKLFDYLISVNKTDINMTIVINLIGLTDSILDKIKQFPNMELWISWDHIRAEEFRFIRYPADYTMFLNNLKRLVNVKKDKLGLSITANIFNMFELADILTEVNSIGDELGVKWMDIVFRNMIQPNYFAINYMPTIMKQTAVDKIKDYIANNNLNQHSMLYQELINFESTIMSTPEDIDEVVKERYRALDIYDNLRGTDYKTLFPYLKETDV